MDYTNVLKTLLIEDSRFLEGKICYFGLVNDGEAIYSETHSDSRYDKGSYSHKSGTKLMYAIKICFRGASNDNPIVLAETDGISEQSVYYSQYATMPIYFWDVINYSTGIIKSSGITLEKSEIPLDAKVISLLPIGLKPLESEIIKADANDLVVAVIETSKETEIEQTQKVEEINYESFLFHFGHGQQKPFEFLDYIYIQEFDAELAINMLQFCNNIGLVERDDFSHREFREFSRIDNRLYHLNEKIKNSKVDFRL